MAKKAKKKKASTVEPEDEAQPFEESLGELQGIVGQLEEGSLPLDESMEQFERGIKLLKNCYQVLEAAEQQIEILTRVNANGEMQTSPFDASATFDLRAESEAADNKPQGKPDALF